MSLIFWSYFFVCIIRLYKNRTARTSSPLRCIQEHSSSWVGSCPECSLFLKEPQDLSTIFWIFPIPVGVNKLGEGTRCSKGHKPCKYSQKIPEIKGKIPPTGPEKLNLEVSQKLICMSIVRFPVEIQIKMDLDLLVKHLYSL